MKNFKFVLLLLLFSCNSDNYEEFDFSYNNTFETSFSIKFTHDNVIFLREHWSANDYDNRIESPKSETNYKAQISFEQKKTLNKLLKSIEFTKLDKTYDEMHQDGVEYQIYFRNSQFSKKIYVHSHHAPPILDSLSYLIYTMKKELKLIKINQKLKFKSEIYVPPPPPPVKLLNEFLRRETNLGLYKEVQA